MLVSAKTGEGIDALLAAIDARLGAGDEMMTVVIPAREGRLQHWLHENTEVLERSVGEDGATQYLLRIQQAKRERLLAQLRRAGLTVHGTTAGG